MENSINWDLIQSGPTFESLVRTLLFFEDPQADLFGRPGQDAAQDIRSGDKTTVYQAKFHKRAGMGKTIRDAREEFDNIKKYQSKGHSNEHLWQGITKWILATNIFFNPNDTDRWEKEIAPLFARIGLDAKIWGCEKLESLLAKHPEVRRAYFESENRIFLSLREARERLLHEEIGEHGLETDMRGRDREFELVEEFLLSEKKVLPIYGPGGIGKSRLLYEIGLRAASCNWQVLWANVESLTGRNWYEAIIPERKTLILIDEPQQVETIKVIFEQISNSTGRSGQWKTVLTVRSPGDPIHKFLNNPRVKFVADALALKPLTKTHAKAMALDLLEKGPLTETHLPQQLEKIANQIAKRFNGPVWIAIAANLLGEKKRLIALPQAIYQLAEKYFNEILESYPEHIASQRELRPLIRWIALYGSVDIENNEMADFFEKLPDAPKKSKIDRCLLELSKKRFLVRRGINKRLYKIKPDVMRDYVLQEWLTLPTDSRRPSGEARELVGMLIRGNEGQPLPRTDKIIESLARTELLQKLEGYSVSLLDPIIEGLRGLALEGSTSEQRNVINFLPHLSFARVKDAVEILRTLRITEKPSEQENVPLWGVHTITHDDIIKKLAWELFRAAKYAESDQVKEILDEMCLLVVEEAELSERTKEKLQNNGKQASSLLQRIVIGEPDFLTDYSEAAFHKAISQIEKLSLKDDLRSGEILLTKALVGTQLSAERARLNDADEKIIFSIYIISLKGHLGIRRAELKNKLREVVASPDVAESNKILAWNLLSEAHLSANRARLPGKGNDNIAAEWYNDLIDDLKWTNEELGKRKLGIKELKAAREIWEWYCQHESSSELKDLAEKCEEIYRVYPLPSYFHDLFDYDNMELAAQKAEEIARELSAVKQASDLFEFVRQVMEFTEEQGKLSQLRGVSDELGRHVKQNQAVNDFVFKALGYSSDTPEFKFATDVINSFLKTVRETETDDLRQLLEKLIETPSSDFDKRQLLFCLYGSPHPLIAGPLKRQDLEFIESRLSLFSDSDDRRMLFRILGSLFFVDWEYVASIVETSWKDIRHELKTVCFQNLFDAIHYISLFSEQLSVNITSDQIRWVVTQMVLFVPDIDELSGAEWHIKLLFKQAGKLPLSWLVEAIQQRVELSSRFEASQVKYKIVPTRLKLCEFICPITPESAKDNTVKESMERLLDFNDQRNLIGYILPKYAVQTDPEGLLIPRLIVDRLSRVNHGDSEQIRLWSRYAGYYPKNSESWRTIALISCRLADKFRERERIKIYSSLESQDINVLSHPAREIDPWYENELQDVRSEFENEIDQELIQYRQWKLNVVEAAYERALTIYRENQEEEEFDFA